MDCLALAQEIINGRRLTREDPLSELVTADLEELKKGPDMIRRALVGEKVDLCTIISGISGRCSENCRFCAQSGRHHTDCEVHGLLDRETIMEEARSHQEEATWICYVTGTWWLAKSTGMSFGAALAAGVIPFILVDFAKIMIAGNLGPVIRRSLEKARVLQ